MIRRVGFLNKGGVKIKKDTLTKVIVLTLAIMFIIWLGFFVGIDFSIKTLLIVMVIDYIIGLSLAITGNSKHGDGGLSSKVGYKGLIKKIVILLVVGLAAILEDYLIVLGVQFEYIQSITVVAFIINEVVSIIENAKMAGLEIPDVLTKIIDVLKNLRLKK